MATSHIFFKFLQVYKPISWIGCVNAAFNQTCWVMGFQLCSLTFVDNRKFNVTVPADGIVVTDKSIWSLANSKSSLPIHCSCVAVFDHTVVLNTCKYRINLLTVVLSCQEYAFVCCWKQLVLFLSHCVLFFGSLLDDAVESHHCRWVDTKALGVQGGSQMDRFSSRLKCWQCGSERCL